MLDFKLGHLKNKVKSKKKKGDRRDFRAHFLGDDDAEQYFSVPERVLKKLNTVAWMINALRKTFSEYGFPELCNRAPVASWDCGFEFQVACAISSLAQRKHAWPITQR